ncbi:MAG TPA: YkgJ family cysteine cluster protein [Acidimicrobiales bacterium]|nr:YkgJ family cysteine cluster protein [Acidimicrobiales bacterium]
MTIDFAAWRSEFRRALDEGGATDVPCEGCTACCRSGQFVLIERDEAAALGRIPPRLLVPAPGREDGAMVMGYDERGRCPMLGDVGCSIYTERPRTCRTYDCRVFAAAGIVPEQAPVAEAVARWGFTDPPERTAVREKAAAAVAAGEDPRRAALRAVLEGDERA